MEKCKQNKCQSEARGIASTGKGNDKFVSLSGLSWSRCRSSGKPCPLGHQQVIKCRVTRDIFLVRFKVKATSAEFVATAKH